MGKVTVGTVGQIKIKMDVKDSVYGDKKDPHISMERKGAVILNHIYLSEVDRLVGNDKETKEAIYWLRDNKEKLKKMYQEYNN